MTPRCGICWLCRGDPSLPGQSCGIVHANLAAIIADQSAQIERQAIAIAIHKSQRKGLKKTMEDELRSYKELKGQQCNYIVPPVIVGRMSGAKYARQDKTGAITLTYESGAEDSSGPNAPEIGTFENFFAIVRFVQDSLKSRKGLHLV